MAQFYVQKTLETPHTQKKTIGNKKYSKVVGYKINMQNSAAFLYTNKKPVEQD